MANAFTNGMEIEDCTVAMTITDDVIGVYSGFDYTDSPIDVLRAFHGLRRAEGIGYDNSSYRHILIYEGKKYYHPKVFASITFDLALCGVCYWFSV